MKKIYLLGIMLMLIAVGAQAAEAPAISITLLNQDPDPVGPGRYVELRFKIQNTRPGTIANNFQLMIDPIYPFFLDQNEVPERTIDSLPAMGDANVYIVRYKLRVDDRAVQGTNPVRVRFRHDSTDWISQEFLVNIRTVDANLGITDVLTLPDKIRPGEMAVIEIKIKNMADSVMKDVSLKLDLTFSALLEQKTALTASDSLLAYNALPFVPVGSSTEQKIDRLLSGEEYTFTYNLIAYPDATSKVYKIPIRISYYDELGNNFVKNDIIGVVVGTKPELSVIIEETDLTVGKNSGRVILKFINKGFTDVKFLDIIVNDTDCFKVISASEVYVGNVDSDDYETAEFRIYCTSSLKQETTIDFPVYIRYRDANNNLYLEEHVLKLKVFSPKVLGQGNGFSMINVLVILVIIGAVAFYIRRRRKKEKR